MRRLVGPAALAHSVMATLLAVAGPVPVVRAQETPATEEPAGTLAPAGASDEKKATPKQEPAATPKLIEVKREPFRVELSLDGHFSAEDSAAVSLRPEVWSNLQVERVVPHGTEVKAGETILWLDTRKLDEQLESLRHDLEMSRLSLEIAEIQRRIGHEQGELELREAQQNQEHTASELKYFEEVDREQSERSARFSLKSSEHQLEYAREELAQLQKMYEADDLTEETEEIVLKRARHDLEFAEYALAGTRANTERQLNYSIPRQQLALQTAADRAALNHQRITATRELEQEKERLESEKSRRDQEELERKIAQLEADRELLEVKAPLTGVVYYGELSRGRPSDASSQAARLRPGMNIGPNEVILTVLATRPLRVTADVEEKSLSRAQPGRRAEIVATAFPEHKLSGRIKQLGQIPLGPGSFDCTLTVDDVPADMPLVPGMSCKATVLVYDNPHALTVPVGSVFEDNGDQVVYVQRDQAAPQRRVVKLGERTEERVEILSGLEPGDKIRAEKP